MKCELLDKITAATLPMHGIQNGTCKQAIAINDVNTDSEVLGLCVDKPPPLSIILFGSLANSFKKKKT